MSVWDVVFSREGSSLTEADFDAVEQQLGAVIPTSLRAFYRVVNGGRPSRNVFVDQRGDDYEVQAFLRFGESDGAGIEGTFETMTRRGLISPKLLPFGVDSGGNYYCVDSRGRVLFAAMDVPGAEPIVVAPTVKNFVGGLISSEEAYGP